MHTVFHELSVRRLDWEDASLQAEVGFALWGAVVATRRRVGTSHTADDSAPS